MRTLWVFGCSFSAGLWATVADFVALSFDRAINLAGPGQSNRYLVDRFFELVGQGWIDPRTDHVFFQTTGWGRFGYWTESRGQWTGYGDLFGRAGERAHPYPVEAFEPRQAVYANYAALHALALYLDSSGFRSTRVRGMDFAELWSPDLRLRLPAEDFAPVDLLERRHFALAERPSIWHHCLDSRGGDREKMYRLRFHNGHEDAHPYIDECYEYVRQYLPEFDGERAREFRDRCRMEFGWASPEEQGERYGRIRRQYGIERVTTTHNLWLVLPDGIR